MKEHEQQATNMGSNEDAGISRRGFVTGLLGTSMIAGIGALAGCSPKAADAAPAKAVDALPDGVPAWLGVEPQIDNIAETIETEVLVCGAGTGGLFAACAAAEGGAKVIALEKSKTSGGVRDNIGSVGSRLQKANNCVIDTEEMLFEMTRIADGQCNAKLHRLWADESADAVDWYQDRIEERPEGLQLWHEADFTHNKTRYKHYDTGHIPSWPADAEFAGIDVPVNGKNVLGDYLEKHGGEIRFSTQLVKLVKEGGKVVGAIAKDGSGRYIRINASKGVVVSTGGYAWNTDMMDALQPHTQNYYSLCIAVPGTTGDGIKACLWAGAAMDTIHNGMVFDRVAVKPDEVGGHNTTGVMMWIGSNPWLKVNLKGERFANESSPYDHVPHSAATQPDYTWCTIWDSDWQSHVAQFDVHGCCRVVPFDNGAPTNVSLEAEIAMNEGLMASGHIQKADTIEELAQKLNIPVAAFKATVERQNENYDNQFDPDFGKEPFRLTPIRKAPFYGARTSGYLLCTLDGITINTDMQALDVQGNPIDGLYVVGNDSGGYYGSSYFNMSTGNAAGRTVTFGRHVGKLLAKK
jgi:succinate dehydrogenase/fumarate reductase flavoprotein subunit